MAMYDTPKTEGVIVSPGERKYLGFKGFGIMVLGFRV